MILFVCTGNTCRSPLAESYMKTVSNHPVGSRGLFVSTKVISENSQKIIDENNLEPASTPEQLTYEDTVNHTLLVMTKGHLIQVKQLNPDADVHLVSEYVGEKGDVTDPFGGSLDVYKLVFEQLKSYIDKIKL